MGDEAREEDTGLHNVLGGLGIDLGQPASYRRLTQFHIPAELANAQALGSDHFNDLQFEAGVEDSSFGFRHGYYSGDLHLSVCANSLDQDIQPVPLIVEHGRKFSFVLTSLFSNEHFEGGNNFGSGCIVTSKLIN